VKIGLVASLNRPGGNATGISDAGVDIGAKRLGLLHELLPGAARFGVLVNPDNPFITESFVAELQTAATASGGKSKSSPPVQMATSTWPSRRLSKSGRMHS
jgi:putative ABC transport system substrate-binding protein